MKQAPSIAIVCPRFPEGATIGGAETLMKYLAGLAASAGCRVRYLTTCAESHVTWENTRPAGTRQEDSFEVEYFPVDTDRDTALFHTLQQRIGQGAILSQDDQQRWITHSVNSRDLCQHLAEKGAQYDVIIPGPYLFGLTVNSARVHPAKTLLLPCLHDESFAYQHVIGDLFSLVAGFIFNAEAERKLACRLYDLPAASGQVVGIGLDPAPSAAHPPRALNGISAPYLMYSGRREPLKGTDLLLHYLDAFRQRTGRDVKLVLTGSGTVLPPPSLQSHVIDLGFVSEQEKHAAMKHALAFVHPSTNESLGIVLLEAWLNGTPALVHAGSAVLAEHCTTCGGGLPFAFYPEFEEALCWMLDHPSERIRMGQAGQHYVQATCSHDQVRERFLQALHQVDAIGEKNQESPPA